VIYEFQATDGEVIEESFPMADAPRIGSVITRNGKQYMRLASLSAQVQDHAWRVYPVVSRSLPRNLAGCKTNAAGQPVFASRREEREMCARHDYVKD
jgi:hypothetical protein